MRTIDKLRREFPGGWSYDPEREEWCTPLIAFVRYRVHVDEETANYIVCRMEERNCEIIHGWMEIASTVCADRAGFWARVDFDGHLADELKHHEPTKSELEIMAKLNGFKR